MLVSKLIDRDIRPTNIRLMVLQFLLDAEFAISLKELEGKFDRADTATLFRTLKTFEEKGLVHGIIDGSGSTKYALCEENCECEPADQHVHFKCTKCKSTICLTQAKVPLTQVPIGFNVSNVSMVYEGVCPACS
ncbi:MAG: transcriptional repressor [Cyclobacteriaceae bacterium]